MPGQSKEQKQKAGREKWAEAEAGAAVGRRVIAIAPRLAAGGRKQRKAGS